MRPLTEMRPKPLIEVAGKPLIEHVIGALPSVVDELVIVIGYKGAMVRERLGERFAGLPVRYVEQERPAGTASALALTRPFLRDRFLVMCADDIHGAGALAKAACYPLAVLAAEHADPSAFGVLEADVHGILRSFEEKPKKPKSHLVSTGALMLDERVFAQPIKQHANGEYYLTEQVAALAKRVPVHVITQDLWIPVGTPPDIKRAERILAGI